jgi:hypothetical protein
MRALGVMIIRAKKYPKLGTSSSERYYYSDLETTNFINWVTFMASGMDEMRRIASEALSDEEGEEEIENLMIAELKKNRLLLFYMLHCRLVDNFLTYLSEVLVECFRAKPESMKSSEKIEISEVLQFDTFSELVDYVADKKVHSLSYQSILDLDDYFQSRFGVNIVLEEAKSVLLKAVETRNLITHNRGIRNKRYMNKLGEAESTLGVRRDIGIDFYREIDQLLFENIKRLDTSLRKKLGVPGHRFNIYETFSGRT